MTASFGQVVLYIRVPAVTGERELWDALEVEPPEGAEVFIAPDGQVYHVTIMWPGVEASGGPLPDPVQVSSSGEAPPGVAVTMRVRIDSKKFPAIGDVSGDDGIFEVVVKRTRCAELSIQSLDEPRVRLPLEGFRSVHSVKTGPHRFLLTFSKPGSSFGAEGVAQMLGGSKPEQGGGYVHHVRASTTSAVSTVLTTCTTSTWTILHPSWLSPAPCQTPTGPREG